MARERPTASSVSPSPDPTSDDAAGAEVAAIIARAATLGFSPVRVATALGVAPSELAAIEFADPAAGPPDHR